MCPMPGCEYSSNGVTGNLRIRLGGETRFLQVRHREWQNGVEKITDHYVGKFVDGRPTLYYSSANESELLAKANLRAQMSGIGESTAPTMNIIRNRGFLNPNVAATTVSGKNFHALGMTEVWVSSFRSVQKYLDYLHVKKSGSVLSVYSFAHMLGRFCRDCNMTPDEVVELPRERVEELVQGYCDRLAARTKNRGSSMQTPNGAIHVLRSFFAVNGFNSKNNKALRVEGYYQPPRTRNVRQYVPTLEEALRMAERARCKRDRALILVALTTGLRNSALRAIKVGDIRQQVEEGSDIVRLSLEPDWNETRVSGSVKHRIPYYVFIAPNATKAVKEWLDDRATLFGSYDDDEPLFCSLYNNIPREQRKKTLLSAREVQVVVRRAGKAASIKEWNHIQPHALRKAFYSVLRAPLVDNGKMDEADQEFFMGHILGGSRDHYFDPTKVEQMRLMYSKLNFDPTSYKGQNASLFLKLATAFGLDPQRVLEQAKVAEGHELSALEKETALIAAIKEVTTKTREREQKVCPVSDLERYMGDGWFFRASLPEGRVVVER